MAQRTYPARPGSAGFNGHAKSCDCDRCADCRAAVTEGLWEANGRFAVPASREHTVFVKSFFRRQPNHLTKSPNARARMLAIIRDIRRLARM